MTVEVVEFTDPGCSWAWGTEPKRRRLRWRYGDRLAWRRVMGGLVGDMDRYFPDGFDPVRAAPRQSRYWADVASRTAMTYPARLAYHYRSTEPACRAVKAAERQSDETAERVLRRLREATFVFGTPPDTTQRILAAVRGVPGLDEARLAADLDSPDVEDAFREDWEATRRPNEYVMTLEESPDEGGGRAKHTEGRWRYVFPTMIFQGPAGEVTVPGWKPWERYVEALEAVSPGITAGPRPDPSPVEAFAAWPTLAPIELETLCGPAAALPEGVVTYDWGDGAFYMTGAERDWRD